MNVLVVGGLGYVGSTLVSYLLENTSYQITILDRLDYNINRNWYFSMLHNNRVKIVKGDCRAVDVFYPLLKECDAIVNLAALVGEPICEKKPAEAILTNEVMAKTIGHMCNMENKRLIFLSTCSNYGQSDKLVDEESQLLPVSLYAITKVNTEKYLRKNVNNSILLRCATAYGVSAGRMRWDLLLNDFVMAAFRDKKIDIFGPQAYRPLCHVEDIARAILLAIERPKQDGCATYNVGSNDQNHTKEEIASMVSEVTKAEIVFTDMEEKRNYRVDFTKIKNELGYSTKYSIRDGIRTMYDALKNREIELVGSNV